MTDFDELASAYLDDAATAEERARVDADPVLRRRVDELRRARDAVAAAPVPPPDATARDEAVRAAVAAADVVVLRDVRARRRLRVASIAAAALVAIGLAGLLIRAQSDETSKTASTAATASQARSAAAAPNEASSAVRPQTAAVDGALGSFSNRDELVAAVQKAVTTPRTAGAAADTAAAPSAGNTGTVPVCTSTAPAGATQTLLASMAVLGGDAVQVEVYALTDGSRRLVVTERLSCAEVFSQTL